MKRSVSLAAAIAATSLIVACNGGASSVPATSPAQTGQKPISIKSTSYHHQRILVPRTSGKRAHDASGALLDGGFESGGYTYWQQCGSVNAQVTSARAHSGTYSDYNGTTSPPEVNGYSGLCQQVTVPTNGQITFWVYEGTNETSTYYADQEADLLDSSGYTITTMFMEDANTNGWVQRTYDLSAYAGQSVWLFFGVYGNGNSGYYIYQYVDDVAWAGSATPTPAPTATPTPHATPTPTPHASPTPTAKPSATPTAKPTATPTAKPTATPTAKPTATPTPKPTATPTPVVTPTPSGGATPFPTPPGSGPHGTTCGSSCGVQRWHIKTLDDPQENLINWNTQLASVSQLAAIPVPAGYDQYNDTSRYAPTETQVYRVRAILVGWKSESDQDFHIVIADTNNPSNTMIVEPPNSGCSDACDAGFGSLFDAVRSKFETCFGSVPSSFTNLPSGIVADLTGVPLFDALHGQTGVAPNGIELHALLDVQFVSGQPANCPAIARAPHSVVSRANLRKAYQVGLRLMAQDRAKEREDAAEVARAMTLRLTGVRENQRSATLSLDVVNTTTKSVKGLVLSVNVTSRDGKRLGRAEVRVADSIAPGATRSLSVPLRYVAFGAKTGAIVEAVGQQKTYEVDIEEISYSDGSEAGFDD